MYARLMDIIDHLGSPRVLLVGDFMLDEYVFGDADRISPEAPVPVLSVVNREYRAGGSDLKRVRNRQHRADERDPRYQACQDHGIG